jgi:hypothetical protein
MNIITATERNDFIVNILDEIIKSFPYIEYKGDCSVKLAGKGAIVFARQKYGITQGTIGKYLEYRQGKKIVMEKIKFIVLDSIIPEFLTHLDKFGIIKRESIEKNGSYTTTNITLNIVYNPVDEDDEDKIYLSEYNPYLSFFLKDLYQIYGDIVLNIQLITLENDYYDIYSLNNALLSESFVAEYILSEKRYYFSIDNTGSEDICLHSILKNIKIQELDSEKGIHEFDEEQFTYFEKSLKFLATQGDMFLTKRLKPNETEVSNPEFCTICLDVINDKGYKTPCSHYFHFKCLSSFLKKYYEGSYISSLQNRSYVIEHDINGNILKGGKYEYSCPNCKSECFKIESYKKNYNSEIVYLRDLKKCIFQV